MLDIKYNKKLLDEVFAISRIGKVKIGVISQRLRLITLAETLLILDINKTESNNCFILQWMKKKWSQQEMELIIYFLTCKNLQISTQHKACKLDMISLRNHALQPYMTWLPMTFVLDNLQLDDIPVADFKIHCILQPIRKEIVSWMKIIIFNILFWLKPEQGSLSRAKTFKEKRSLYTKIM